MQTGVKAVGGGCDMEQFAPVRRSKDGQPVRYLIVDDSVFARRNLARMIESFGGQVASEAGDGLAAITEYDRTNPDIVLMDITMPQMEGIEAAEKIVRQHPEARIVWCLLSVIRRTSWRRYSAAHVISCRSRSSRKFSTKSSSTCWERMLPCQMRRAQEPRS